jgi:hypothetical protein
MENETEEWIWRFPRKIMNIVVAVVTAMTWETIIMLFLISCFLVIHVVLCAKFHTGGLIGFVCRRQTEFLTHQTTCASEMLEKTTCENFCQKRPPAAWASAGKPLPPFASPACGLAWRQRATSACRHAHWRHVLLPPLPLAACPLATNLPPCPLAARPLAATPIGGMSLLHRLTEGDGRVPALPLAAGACRQRPRRHVPRVAWPRGAATRRGSFLTKIFAGGLF